MILYPAIDLLDDQAVRLRQGDYNRVTAFSSDPLAVARSFEAAGAAWLHLVDLSAARHGSSTQRPLVAKICRETKINVQVGGGIRSRADVDELLEAGADRLVIGTAAVTDPAFLDWAVANYSAQIAVGLDALNGTVRVRGWQEDAGIDMFRFAEGMNHAGVSTLIYTDIDRDGELRGANVDSCRLLKERYGFEVILSGGVSSLTDLEAARAAGLDGAIIGRALYEGAVDLRECLEVAGS